MKNLVVSGLPLVVLSFFGCGADQPVAKPPTATASAKPAPDWLNPPAAPDASMLDPKPAGTTSDCVPRYPNDGDVAEALLAPGGDKLSLCLAYHSAAVTEARTGRACYQVDLAAGRYDRIGPFSTTAPASDGFTAWLAEHPSTTGDFTVKTTATDVTMCKGADCASVHASAYTLPSPTSGDACIPDALRHGIPADVSPDGTKVFLVRHEACDGHIFGETYDAKTKQRVARFPLAADSFVERVMWIGRRVVVRACSDDMNDCTLQIVDPSAPATPTPHGFANATTIPNLNTAGLAHFLFHAKDDAWAIVERLGAKVAFVHADTGVVDPPLELPAAPPLAHPLVAGLRQAPSPQLYLLYGGDARITLVDLSSAQVTATFTAPVCGERN